MRETKGGVALGTAELLTPAARRDWLRWAFVELLATEAPHFVAALEAVFVRHQRTLKSLVKLAIALEGPPPGVRPRHLTLRYTKWAPVLTWQGAVTIADARPQREPADDATVRVGRRVARVLESVREWGTTHGISHDFMLDVAWKTLCSWAQISALPRNRLMNPLSTSHLVEASRIKLPDVPAYNPLMETKAQFLKRAREYTRSVERALRQHRPDLVRRPKKDPEQVRWYIRYQVLNTTRARIARDAGRFDDEEAVKKAIDRFEADAGLDEVPRAKTARLR
jgi:hypothetical protein